MCPGVSGRRQHQAHVVAIHIRRREGTSHQLQQGCAFIKIAAQPVMPHAGLLMHPQVQMAAHRLCGTLRHPQPARLGALSRRNRAPGASCSRSLLGAACRRRARRPRTLAASTPGVRGSELDLEVTVSVVPSMDQVGRDDWNRCATGSGEYNPFVSWDFLHALEASGSAVRERGWLPQHVLARDATGVLVGAAPMYVKGHSYGEYVFDRSWAEHYNQSGGSYYPKLQCCVPFTPVTGPRLLVEKGSAWEIPVRKALAQTLMQIADQLDVSSLHLTFSSEEEWRQLAQLGYLPRVGIQYHWFNRGYGTFDDFLMDLKQPRRKSIRQERKRAFRDNGLRPALLTGSDLKPRHWDAFYDFYQNTVDKKWGQAYLTREFFDIISETMKDDILLVVAEEDRPGGEIAAAALNFIGSDALFGRNWGCKQGLNSDYLHFELCYYQAVEAAISMKLDRVEAGAQGEHKIRRGYLPRMTYSSHYVRDDYFRASVAQFLRAEGEQMDLRMEMLHSEVSPFKDGIF